MLVFVTVCLHIGCIDEVAGFTQTQKKLVSSWIWTSLQLHKVTWGRWPKRSRQCTPRKQNTTPVTVRSVMSHAANRPAIYLMWGSDTGKCTNHRDRRNRSTVRSSAVWARRVRNNECVPLQYKLACMLYALHIPPRVVRYSGVLKGYLTEEASRVLSTGR